MRSAVKTSKNGTRHTRTLLLLIILAALAVLIIENKESLPELRHNVQLEESGFCADDFSVGGSFGTVYTGSDYDTVYGIDVSEYQGDIDWQQVYDSGVRFAILRAGGRAYDGDGSIYTDSCFVKNLEGAQAAGIDVGVYFFSQAVNTDEAVQEAETVLSLIGDKKLQLPVFFDWETIGTQSARTDSLSSDIATDCALAFCDRIRQAGLKAGIYLYAYTANNVFELDRLAGCTLWYAAQSSYPQFRYAHSLWQYSFEGSVPGIYGNCDLDMMFIKK